MSKRGDPRLTTAWKKVRKQVRERDGGCVVCGSRRYLEVHHAATPVRGTHPDDARNYDPAGLVTLCRKHHAQTRRRNARQLPLCQRCGHHHPPYEFATLDANGKCMRTSRPW